MSPASSPAASAGASGRTSMTRRAQRLVDDRAAASAAILDAHARPDALELAADVGQRRGELVGAEVGRVGVVERLEHAPHGALQQLAGLRLRRRTRLVIWRYVSTKASTAACSPASRPTPALPRLRPAAKSTRTAEHQEDGRDDDRSGRRSTSERAARVRPLATPSLGLPRGPRGRAWPAAGASRGLRGRAWRVGATGAQRRR